MTSDAQPNRRHPALSVEELLHPGERDAFTALCVATSASELRSLGAAVDAKLAQVEAAGRRDDTVDVVMARQVASALGALLSDAAALDPDGRALARGAVDYFLIEPDQQDDLSDIIGFDDDARIVSLVCRALGRGDLVIVAS